MYEDNYKPWYDVEDNYKPWYDVEGIECQCIKDGVDSEWEWIPEFGYYMCAGCGAIQ